MSKRIEELGKGCGKFKGIHRGWCNVTKRVFSSKTDLCPECEAKLEERKLAEKEILERISKIDMTKFIPIGVDFYWKDWEEELKKEVLGE